MPKVDMDMTAGTIVGWHVAEGAPVARDMPLFDIETDKAAMEVESPADGILAHVIAGEGASVPIGKPVAWIYADDEVIGPRPEPTVDLPASNIVDRLPVETAPSNEAPKILAIRATPAARRLARERRIDLQNIKGSALRGRIVRADIERLASARARSEPRGLHIVRRGQGDATPIVWLHGLGADMSCWAKVDALLPHGRPSLMIDLPAHGRSPLSSPKDFRALASEVRQTFDELDLGPVHLVGHSLGGALAIALADTRSARVERLTLIAPAGLGPDINISIIHGLIRASCTESLAPWLGELVSDRDLVTSSYVATAIRSRADQQRRLAQEKLARKIFADGTQTMDLSAALARAEMPIRIIWGREDKVIPWQHALRVPGKVSLNLFEHVGHMPQIEQPQAVAALIDETTQ